MNDYISYSHACCFVDPSFERFIRISSDLKQNGSQTKSIMAAKIHNGGRVMGKMGKNEQFHSKYDKNKAKSDSYALKSFK